MEPTAKFLFFILSQILMAFFLFRLLMEFPAFFFPSKFDLALMVSGIQGVKRDQHPIRITCFIISPDPKGHVRYFRHLSSITNFKHYLDRICKKKKILLDKICSYDRIYSIDYLHRYISVISGDFVRLNGQAGTIERLEAEK